MAWEGDLVALYWGVIRELDEDQPGRTEMAPGFLNRFEGLFRDARAMMAVWLTHGGGHMRQFVRLYRAPSSIVDLLVPKTEIRIGEELENLAATVASLLATGDVDAYFVAGDAWIAGQDKDEGVSKLLASQRSQRLEVMAIGVGLRDRGHRVRFYEVERPWTGAPATVSHRRVRDGPTLDHPLYKNLYGEEDPPFTKNAPSSFGAT